MSKLILMRHGESVWNKLNLFTGWVDIPLSEKGIDEALFIGEQIKDLQIDVIFTSTLIRAQMSALLSMLNHSSKKTPLLIDGQKEKPESWYQVNCEKSRQSCIPCYCAWELNERMYGQLQGLNKAETIAKYGADQVKLWRRSFDIAPPEGESLAMTAERSIPYFRKSILPFLNNNKHVFIAAHGNSLRSIVMDLENFSKDEILNFEIPTGGALIYNYSNSKFVREMTILPNGHAK